MKASEAHLYIYKLVQTACTAVVINVFSFCIDFYIILMFCLLVSIYIIFSTLVIATIFGQPQYNEILTFFNLCKGNEITWPNLAYFKPKLFRRLHWGYLGSHFDSRNFRWQQGATSTPEIFSNKHSFVLTFFTTEYNLR